MQFSLKNGPPRRNPGSATVALFTSRKRSLRRLCFYRCLSVHRGGRALQGVCMAGAYMAGGVHGRGRTWQAGDVYMAEGVCMAGGACMAGGMHHGGACMAGGVCGEGACVHGGGHAWQGGHVWWDVCMAGEGVMHGRGGLHGRYYEIRSMSGRYASYWNAFLFKSRKGRHTPLPFPSKNLSTLRIFLPSFHYDNSHYTLFVSFSVAYLHGKIWTRGPSRSNFLHFHTVFDEIWPNNRLASTFCRNSGSATGFLGRIYFRKCVTCRLNKMLWAPLSCQTWIDMMRTKHQDHYRHTVMHARPGMLWSLGYAHML